MKMNKIFPFSLLIILFFGCMRKSSPNISASSWQQEWMYKLVLEYIEYKKSYPNMCSDEKRDLFLDFGSKAYSMKDYPADRVFKEIKRYFRKNHIQFDSCTMVHFWYPEGETLECSAPQTYLIVNKDTEVEYYDVWVLECDAVRSIRSISDIYSNYLLSTDFKDSCAFGYLARTKIRPNWSWKIESITLNPDIKLYIKPEE